MKTADPFSIYCHCFLSLSLSLSTKLNHAAFALSNAQASLMTCEAAEADCRAFLEFGRQDKVVQFSGKPPSAWEVAAALQRT